MAEDWLEEYDNTFLPFMVSFRIKDSDVYPPYMFREPITEIFSARKWWAHIKIRAEKAGCPSLDFCDFMIGLHSAPSSSASLERIFSTFGHVWSKLRNRLGPQKATKLVKVYKYLRAQDSSDLD